MQQSFGELESWLFNNSECLKYSELDILYEDVVGILKEFQVYLCENKSELESRVVGESFQVLLEEVKTNIPAYLRHEEDLYYIQKVNKNVWSSLSVVNKQKLVWVTFYKRFQLQNTFNHFLGINVLP